tara:strand:- start:3186 stop:3470 length:285 start_codon:yes stop_codon:yes gene_type:complete
MGVRENKVEKYLNKKVEELGGITRKWVSPGRDGVPDRIVIIRGNVIFVEVKTSDGKLSTAQKREHERLESSGTIVYTVYGEEGVDSLMGLLCMI